MKSREGEIEEARPKDLHYRCDDTYCCAKNVWVEACKWADENPRLSKQEKKICADMGRMAYSAVSNQRDSLQQQLAIAEEALKYIGNSIPGPEQQFELENKNAAQSALAKIEKLKST